MTYQAQDTSEADIVVIGGGPGGYVASIRAAQLGAKVFLVEKEALGGVCTNGGCIPSKALLRNAQMFSPLLGCFEDLLSFNIKAAMERKTAIVETLVKGIETLLKRNGVNVIYGLGRITAPNTVTVELNNGQTTTVKRRNIIIATGSTPTIPSVPGIEGRSVITTDQALDLLEVPESVLIIGGGYV
ncbi:NAD(P)/FAD-dependent oxidoreductase, partial [bacterium]